MRMRILTVLALAAALAVPAGPASASGSRLCMNSAPSLCQVSPGGGAQITVNSGGAGLTFTQVGIGTPDYMISNSNGKCWRGNSSDQVVEEPGGCSAGGGDENEVWIQFDFGGVYRFENEALGLYMGTTGTTAGDKVWLQVIKTGDYTGWGFR